MSDYYISLSLLPFLSAMAAGSAPNAFVDRCEHEDEYAVQRAVLVAAQVSAPDSVRTPTSCRVLPCQMYASLLTCATLAQGASWGRHLSLARFLHYGMFVSRDICSINLYNISI